MTGVSADNIVNFQIVWKNPDKSERLFCGLITTKMAYITFFFIHLFLLAKNTKMFLSYLYNQKEEHVNTKGFHSMEYFGISKFIFLLFKDHNRYFPNFLQHGNFK